MRFDLITIAALTPFLMIGTSGAECSDNEMCPTTFADCVATNNCDECLDMLQQEGSDLESVCAVGCELSDLMKDLCRPADKNALVSAFIFSQ
eukprot:4586272-Ditylum_brightwellii.AAC.1